MIFTNSGTPTARLTARGFAWIGAKHRLHGNLEVENGQIVLDFRIKKTGYFSELTHEIHIKLPEDLKGKVEVNIQVQRATTDSVL